MAIQQQTVAICLVVVCGTALLIAQDSVAADPHVAGVASAEMEVTGSDGSLISIRASEGQVSVTVSPRALRLRNQVRSEYLVSGSTSGEAVQASFGRFGEISVHFVPSGDVKTKTVELPPGCDGPKKIVRRQGTFVGTIRFVGENGYTSIDLHEAIGSVGTTSEFFCVFGGPIPSGNWRIPTILDASTAKRHLTFEATQLRPGEVEFTAAETSKVDGVSILRLASKTGRPSRFRFDRDLRTATAAPPAPFSGTAMFRRGARRPAQRWSGSLAVSFPGEPNVPLAGAAFTELTLSTL